VVLLSYGVLGRNEMGIFIPLSQSPWFAMLA